MKWYGKNLQRMCTEKLSQTIKTTCAKSFPFFHLLLTTHHHNLPRREQTHLSAYSSNLCFIHAGFCYNISKRSPSKVLHNYKQFISHQVTKKRTHRIYLHFHFFLNTWHSMLKNSNVRHTNNKTKKLIALRARKKTRKLLPKSTEK